MLVSGLHARGSGVEEHIENYHCQQNDVCMLRLFEAYLESAPQLTLQLYIMMCTNEANWLTGVYIYIMHILQIVSIMRSTL